MRLAALQLSQAFSVGMTSEKQLRKNRPPCKGDERIITPKTKFSKHRNQVLSSRIPVFEGFLTKEKEKERRANNPFPSLKSLLQAYSLPTAQKPGRHAREQSESPQCGQTRRRRKLQPASSAPAGPCCTRPKKRGNQSGLRSR